MLAAALLLIALLLCLLKFPSLANKIFTRSHATIPGAFVIPGLPFFGNTFQVLRNPSLKFLEWAKKYNSSIFVIHLGTLPVIVVNSYEDVVALWRSNTNAMGSRPTLYTFHKIVSAVQGSTVGSTPAGDSFKRKKRSISSNLSPLVISSSIVCKCVDINSKYILANLLAKQNERSADWVLGDKKDVSFLAFGQCYVIQCAVSLTYGIQLDTLKKDNVLAKRIIETENRIIKMRSLMSNYQDYLFFFNWNPIRSIYNANANRWRLSRDTYMEEFSDRFEKNYSTGDSSAKTCLLVAIQEEKSPQKKLSSLETLSVCLSMMSAGLDNVSLVLNHILGQFSLPKKGYEMQKRLHRSLLDLSNNDSIQAWEDVAEKMECAYAIAIIEESLRFFTVLPLSLPRETTKPITYKNLYIPAGTIMVMNAYEANHDPTVFEYPYIFNPERWLDPVSGNLKRNQAPHVSFGSGSRKCSGDHLAMKEIYTLLCRLVILFKIKKPIDPAKRMTLDPFKANSCPSAISFEPEEFHIRLQQRQGEYMYELMNYVLS